MESLFEPRLDLGGDYAQGILSGAKTAALDLLGRRALHTRARRGFRLICPNSARPLGLKSREKVLGQGMTTPF